MLGLGRVEIPVLDEYGFVALVDVMPRMVPVAGAGGESPLGDSAIVQAARVSRAGGTKAPGDDRVLIRYLMRHGHMSPFEQAEVKFHVSMPIFVARQWVRHRAAHLNEVSARYSELPDHFYIPRRGVIGGQSRANRQGRDDALDADVAGRFRSWLESSSARQHADYTVFTGDNVARELARLGLPVNVYTQWYWKCDLRNVLHFLALRMDRHAQWEIRQYANAVHDLIAPLFPFTFEAWREYEVESVRLTRAEVAALASGASAPPVIHENQREQREWEDKWGRVREYASGGRTLRA